MTALASYSTGTVTVAANGTVVTGVGTIWTGVNVRPGDILQIGNFQTIISDVTDVTHLVIPEWGGGAQTGVAYTIWQWFPQRVAGAQAMADVSTLVAAMDTTGFFFFVDVSLANPDPSLGSDGQYALQPTTGKMWVKASGAWSYLGIYRGMNFRGAYDNASTYSVGDVQTTAGTSYVWINPTPGSGHPAPDATYWQVLASKGDTGAIGPQGAGYGGTSTTSLTIGTGNQDFLTQAGLAYTNGARVRITANSGGLSNWMEGVAFYVPASGAMTVVVDKINGAGTFANWNVNVVGQPGAGDLSSANHLTDVTLTAPGGVARSAAAMILDVGNIKNYGAIGDGVADDTAAFQAAIAALPGGGRVSVPRGFYRITSSLNLHSGLMFFGESCVTNVYGLPTGNERPSHIFIDSDTLSLFVHTAGVQVESVGFTDLSFGARLTPNTTPRGSTVCFSFSGSYPNDIKHLTYDRCQFSNFGGYAFRVRDPLAPHSDPDWNVCPVTMNDCTFYYNTVDISFETDNADYWQLNGTSFFHSTGQYGIICQRSGVLVLNQCFGGGGTMLVTGGGGTQSRDSITFIACQYENATAMLQVADNMPSQRTYRPIKMISCVVESPILLDASCHFISEGSRYVSNINVSVAGVLIDSYSDSFTATTAINLVAGSSVRNFITHGADYPIGVRGPIIDGKCVRTASAPPSGGAVGYLAGDITYNSAPSTGAPMGWICTAGGSPGTWDILGQIGFRVNAGTPVGVLTPRFLGEEVLDNTTAKWWKSIDVGISNWVALN